VTAAAAAAPVTAEVTPLLRLFLAAAALAITLAALSVFHGKGS